MCRKTNFSKANKGIFYFNSLLGGFPSLFLFGKKFLVIHLYKDTETKYKTSKVQKTETQTLPAYITVSFVYREVEALSPFLESGLVL